MNNKANSLPKTINAVFIHGPNDVRVDAIDCPLPGDNDVLVRVDACGICGSDLSFIKQGYTASPEQLPTPLGHELAATIAAIGSNVSQFSVGQRVIVNPYINLIGNGGTEGGFADFLLVANVAAVPESLIAIPDNLSAQRAALAEPLAVALHTVNRAQTNPAHKVAVFGAGPIGLGVVIGLRKRGVTDIVVVDYSAERLERAMALGARATINPSDIDTKTALLDLHGEQSGPMGDTVASTDTFIDVAGAAPVIPSILDMARFGARLVVTAVYNQPLEFNMITMLLKEINLTMSIGYPDGELDEVIEMLQDNKTDLSAYISHQFNFDDFLKAHATASNPQTSAKVMVNF